MLAWLGKHRLPHFCKSSLCLHLVLCHKLLAFIRSGEAGESSRLGGNQLGFFSAAGFPLSPGGAGTAWSLPSGSCLRSGFKKALHIPFLGMQQVPMGCAGIYSSTLLVQAR